MRTPITWLFFITQPSECGSNLFLDYYYKQALYNKTTHLYSEALYPVDGSFGQTVMYLAQKMHF